MKNIIKSDVRFAFRSDTRENWEQNNPTLLAGEHGVVTDGSETEREKIGDGVTPWNELGWWRGSTGKAGVYYGTEEPTDPSHPIWVNPNSDAENLLDLLHPIGSIYLSASEINPKLIFGGEWEQIKDTFLLACGDNYAAGSIGGESEHKLTVNEIPSHSHEQNIGDGTHSMVTHSTGGYSGGKINSYQDIFVVERYPVSTNKTGGGQAHNNMPPYLAVYVWKRIS